MRFGGGEAEHAALEIKDENTVAGQLELAHAEASNVNAEYDRRVDAARKALEDLAAYVREANEKATDRSSSLDTMAADPMLQRKDRNVEGGGN